MVLGVAPTFQDISEPNIEARLRNHCCRVKAIIITYSKCVFVALGIHKYVCVCVYIYIYIYIYIYRVFGEVCARLRENVS